VRGVRLALVLLVSDVGVATAQPISADLQVERAPGAEECAGEPELRAAVENILQRRWSNREASELGILVRFEHATGAFVARISARGPKAGERLLRDVSATCGDVSRGAAVAIALILDSEPSSDTVPPDPAPAAATLPAPAETTRARPPSKTGLAWSPHVELAIGAAYGLGGASAAVGFLRAGVRAAPWFFDLGIAGNWPAHHDFDGGTVRTQLSLATLRGCYASGASWALGPCVQLSAGRLQGRGEGYGEERVSHLPWYALGIGLRGQLLLSRRWFAAAEVTWWLPSQRQRFAVQNSGIAWESKSLAADLSLGLGLRAF